MIEPRRVPPVLLPVPDKSAPDYSEEQLALDFANQSVGKLCHVAGWGCWMVWNGYCWHQDTTNFALSQIRPINRLRAKRLDKRGKESDARLARSLASAKTAAGVERLARADRRLAAASGQWDQDTWLLATPGGTIDLRTGELRGANPEDFITRCTSARPAASSDAPLWFRFLNFVTQGDTEYAAYLQRVAGYCLTGSTREQALFFIHGPGGNGKSVFLNVLIRILGSYATPAAMETFIDTGRTEHPTDLAMLRGARLVTATETEEGRRWAEAKIKQLTGGDPILARFMRQDFFEFTPQFKLLIAGNYRPSLRNVDESTRRRFNVLPFMARYQIRDPDLEEKLIAEAPAILRWLIEGCLAWQREGLMPPAVVRLATDAYFRDEDVFRRWKEECCLEEAHKQVPFAELRQSWEAWTRANGEAPNSPKWFSRTLASAGFEKVRLAGGRAGISGLVLKRRSMKT